MKRNLIAIFIVFAFFTRLNAQWNLTGNTGTTPGTNFLGTTDAKALMFKVNNQRSGYIDYNSNKANTSFGYKALININGSSLGGNSAFGYQSLFMNTGGSFNTAIGQ